jgi:uncharacterized damage-inducible protein DinB
VASGRKVSLSPASERELLTGFLDRQRAALLRKLDGVSEADARRVPTASSLSLLGILKHSALWERRWFQVIVAGRTFPGEWPEVQSEDNIDDFRLDDGDTVAGWLAYYAEQVAASRQVVAERDLDAPCAQPENAGINVRYVLAHMIEEVARHAGHADIIRETIDGSTGQ